MERTKRLNERVVNHVGRDTKSHIVRHCLNSDHENVNTENLTHFVYAFKNPETFLSVFEFQIG